MSTPMCDQPNHGQESETCFLWFKINEIGADCTKSH